jgi:hypothetical protein
MMLKYDLDWEIEQIEDAILYYKEALDLHPKSNIFKEKINILYSELKTLRYNYINSRISDIDNVYKK